MRGKDLEGDECVAANINVHTICKCCNCHYVWSDSNPLNAIGCAIHLMRPITLQWLCSSTVFFSVAVLSFFSGFLLSAKKFKLGRYSRATLHSNTYTVQLLLLSQWFELFFFTSLFHSSCFLCTLFHLISNSISFSLSIFVYSKWHRRIKGEKKCCENENKYLDFEFAWYPLLEC